MNEFIKNLIQIGSLLVVGFIGFKIITSYIEWFRNNRSPQETYIARVTNKRTQIFGGRHASTNYFITFEWQNGQHKEFRMNAQEYELFSQGDKGTLTFQGTRFLGFERL